MVRIFEVEYEHQEACNGKISCKDFYTDFENIVADDAISAGTRLVKKLEGRKPKILKNDNGEKELYKKVNFRVKGIRFLAEA